MIFRLKFFFAVGSEDVFHGWARSRSHRPTQNIPFYRHGHGNLPEPDTRHRTAGYS
jgi:hypothetical protein